MKPLFIHYDGHRTHAYGGMREIKKKNRKWLSLMIALSITLGGMFFYSEVAADGGQQIHGISVNVDAGGEPGDNYNNDGAGHLGVAIGNKASSRAEYGTAVGPFAKADRQQSIALGYKAQALGEYSAAYAAEAIVANNYGMAFGQGAVVSFGKPLSEKEYTLLRNDLKPLFIAVKTAEGTTVYYQTKILWQDGSVLDKSVRSVAIGVSAAALDDQTVAIGSKASAWRMGALSIGSLSEADGKQSIALGYKAKALGEYSAAYGADAIVANNYGVAFGKGAVVSFGKLLSEKEYTLLRDDLKPLFTAVKTEDGTTVYCQTKIRLQDKSVKDKSVQSVAIGVSAAALDDQTVAIGFKASAWGMGALSIGSLSEADGKQSIALGYKAKAPGDFSTAVGQGSQANGEHAVAIGYGAITEKNQAGVSIGYKSHSMRVGGKGWNPITDQVWDDSELQIETLGLREKLKAINEEISQKQALEQKAKEKLAQFPNDPDLQEKEDKALNDVAAAKAKKNKLFATWETPTGDVAVGNSDTGLTRQITGVTAGSEDTDAVNVAQLKALNRKVDAVSTEIKNKVEDNKIHYLSVGPEHEKNHPAEGNYNNDGARTYGAIAIGIDSVSEDADAISIGRKSYTNGIESIGIGLLANATGDYATVVGHRAQAFGKNASAYGVFSRAYGANGLAIGTAALAAGVKPLTKAEFDALPDEQKAWYNTDKGKQTEFYQYRRRDKDGEVKDIITKGLAVGNYASSIGIGGVAVGDHAKSSDIDNVNGSNFGVAIGAYSQNKVAQGVALGTLSVADRRGNKLGYLPTKNGSIEYFEDAMEAVGKGKEFTELGNEYAQVQEQMNAAKAAYYGNPTNADLKMKYEQAEQKFSEWETKYAIMTAPWVSRKGAVSIGNDKKGQTRQIIGVAAGSEDTDAVNVAQLKALAMLPMNMYFGGKGENNTYTPGKENWSMPLNEFRMDFGDGLKATQVTDKNGKKYTLVTLDKESLKGDPAFKGDKGESGQAGKDGTNGKSAYDIWLDKQTDKTKTEQDFLNSLKGEKGENGATGAAGKDGTNGKSAYDIWLDKQTDKTKTEQDFLNSLKGEKGENGATGAAGKDGTNGKSAYDIWLDKQTDKTKTEQDFLNSLKGEKGENGATGAAGKDGTNGKSAYDIWLDKQTDKTKTEQDFFDSLKGEKGATGQTGAIGAAGKSAYQVWKEQQNPDGSKPNENKTEQEFFNSLKGKDGKDGKNGVAAAVTVKASEKGNDIQEAKFVITPQKPEMTFVGDRNIKTLIEKDNTVKIALQDTITAKTIKVGDKVTITKEGATFDKVTIAGNQGSITGLTNTTWDTTRIVSGRAATEDQVQQATQTMQRQMVNDMNGIAAGNAALAGLHPLAYDDRDKWNLSAAIGKYRGADAVAFGAFYRPNETTQVSLSGAFGTGRHMLMNAGVAWKVGGGSLPGSSKMAMARQLAAQQWEIEQLRRKDRERDKEMAAMKEREAQLWKEVALLKSKT